MAYQAPYVDGSGIHVPTYEERLEDLIESYRHVFGDDVYIEPDSMDYQMLSIFAKAMDDMTGVLVDNYNARNPNYATQTALDLILPLNGIVRNAATYSTCVLKLTGEPEMTVGPGLQAKDENGFVWEIEGEITFDENGVAEADSRCENVGAIAAGIGTISYINTPVPNWYEVTNEAEAVVGDDVETDAAVRIRRALSVSLPSRSLLDGMRAALMNVPDVEHARLYEDSETHSVNAVIKGGDNDEIARVLWLKKSPGLVLTGDSSGTYVDEYGTVNTLYFDRPTEVGVMVQISLRKLTGYDEPTMEETIPKAVAETISALDVHENLIVPTLYGVVFSCNNGILQTFAVTEIKAKVSGGSWVTDTLTTDTDEKLVCSASDVTIVEVE